MTHARPPYTVFPIKHDQQDMACTLVLARRPRRENGG